MARDCYSSSYSQPSLPIHLCFFVLILLMFLGFSWYINYEPVLESVFDQVKLYLMISPLVLLLVVHWLSVHETGRFSHFILLPEKDSLNRAGGTPWGVGFLLVLLLVMISYHSSFQERWFPLLSR
ncbi:Oxidoreductase/transition metal ion-binding protein [Melia azedarach]|uniref:Oxidoreductase/transition metal ion-binding protein n=1 Tax=Melia azedarach TaxID=155640 RepID=A0ACC1XK17_MELAZ|nr:Oxidoreductase/transition metal ion-binding protein [Melia azedarach]